MYKVKTLQNVYTLWTINLSEESKECLRRQILELPEIQKGVDLCAIA